MRLKSVIKIEKSTFLCFTCLGPFDNFDSTIFFIDHDHLVFQVLVTIRLVLKITFYQNIIKTVKHPLLFLFHHLFIELNQAAGKTDSALNQVDSKRSVLVVAVVFVSSKSVSETKPTCQTSLFICVVNLMVFLAAVFY